MDIEVDIEDSPDNSNTKETLIKETKAVMPNTDEIKKPSEPQISNTKLNVRKRPDITSLNEELAKKLKSLDVPLKETVLDENVVSDMEKYLHFEFFEGRPTKTPDRYLKVSY